jgi:hypothetical protein
MMMKIISLIQGTVGAIQGTLGMIQGTFGVIQGTFGVIPMMTTISLFGQLGLGALFRGAKRIRINCVRFHTTPPSSIKDIG